MFKRDKFKYVATLQNGATGQTQEVPFQCYWSPKYEGVLEAVAQAAAAIAWYGSAKDANARTPYAGLTARLAD
jgi:hypothetical protein